MLSKTELQEENAELRTALEEIEAKIAEVLGEDEDEDD